MGLLVSAVRKLAAVIGGNVGSDTAEESDQAGLCCVTEIFVGIEDVFEALEERVVIEGCVGNRAGFQERREKDGASAIAAVILESERDSWSDVRGLLEWREIRSRLFVAAEQARG